MTQSGIGSFNVGVGYNLVNGQEKLNNPFTNTYQFPKPFTNVPVIIININGIGPVTINQANAGIGTALQNINTYQLSPQKITKTGFEVLFDLNLVWHAQPYSQNINIQINFSWMAYDEVTIGA